MQSQEYQLLREKCDEKFKTVFEKYPQDIHCGKGCHQCCLPGLKLKKIEKDLIEEFLYENPKVFAGIKETEKRNPFHGDRCKFLDELGGCFIYSVRPLICRIQGIPVSFQSEGEPFTDVCPLNFEGQNLESLESNDFVHVDTVNYMLEQVNHHYFDLAANFTFELCSTTFDREKYLYHILSREAWKEAERNKVYSPSTLESEGFIHGSWWHQISGSLRRHFTGHDDLLVLQIDPEKLNVAVVEEDGGRGDGERFPHIQGEIKTHAISDLYMTSRFLLD